MSRALLMLLVLLALVAPAGAQEIGGPQAAAIQKLVLGRYPQPGPGCAVAVVKGGRIVHLKGYGLADVRAGKPLTPDSVFDLASVSKQFTAACILLLADRGRLKVDDDVRRYLPELQAGKNVLRIANLLGMTSGLPEYETDEAGATPESVLEEVADQRRRFAPGARYVYTNTNYALLTLVLQRVTGTTQRQFLRQNLFDPLGMKSSDFLERDDYRAPGQVRGYAKAESGRAELSEHPVTGLGDGNVLSTARDMATWLLALRKQAILKKSTWQRAWTSGKLSGGEETGYGFGFEVQDKPRCVYHSGSWYGTATYMAWYPEEDYGVVVLSNLEDSPVDELADGMDALYLR